MMNLLNKLRERFLMKANINDRLTVEPASRGVAYFSYRGLACAININDSNIDTVFEIAKQSLRNAMEREEIIDDRGKKADTTGKTVRAKNKQRKGSPTEPVAGDPATGKVAPILPKSKKSDVR